MAKDKIDEVSLGLHYLPRMKKVSEYCYKYIDYLIKDGAISNNSLDKEHARMVYNESFKPANKRTAFPFSTMFSTLQHLNIIKHKKDILIFNPDILEKCIAKQDTNVVNSVVTQPITPSSSKASSATIVDSGYATTSAHKLNSRRLATKNMESLQHKTPKSSTTLISKSTKVGPRIVGKCNICQIVCTDKISHNAHLKSEWHLVLTRYVNNKKSLVNSVVGVTIEVEDNQSIVTELFQLRTNEVKQIMLKLINESGKDFCVTNVIELVKRDDITMTKTDLSTLKNGTQTLFVINVHFRNSVYVTYPIIFCLKDLQTSEIIYLLKELIFQVHSNIVDDLHAKEKFVKAKTSQVVEPLGGIVRGEHMKRTNNDFTPVTVLQQYHISDQLTQIFNHGLHDFDGMHRSQKFLINDIRKLLHDYKVKYGSKLNEKNYYEMLRLLLFLEEYQMKIDIKKYSHDDGVLLNVKGYHRNCLELKVPGLAEHRPSLLRGDSVYITENASPIKYEGIVHNVLQDSVILGFSHKFINKIHLKNKKYNVSFGFNRVPLRAEHQAINLMKDHGAISILCKDNFQTRELKNHKFVWFNKNIAGNEQQQQAVQHILSQTSRPLPYLIFGPPGTGKTVTLVEAILQVWKLLPTKNMLICAPSNNAADEITKRLADFVPKRDLIRYVAPSYPFHLICDKVKPYVNYRDNEYYHPANSTLLTFRMVITTLVNASRLINGGTPKGHFEFVFIDESGQATESETLIPIAGILTSETTKGAINGQIVLAGDPKQLGPIIHSNQATEYGFATSMLERLMEHNSVYHKTLKGNYQETALTKLVQSYRSHPAILEVPNKLFYDEELIAAADKTMTHVAVGWDHLPNPDIPVVFHSVFGKDDREFTSPSFFNVEEIDVVLSYLDLLIGTRLQGMKIGEEHIGIIAPYRKHVQKLRQACNKMKYGEKLFIGSVEQFQGQERLIIILTTVRSRPEFSNYDAKFHLGFLRNPKRFNVAITRAKALLILVGNPKILLLDSYWHAFIKYCKENRCLRGAHFNLDINTSNLEERLNSLNINEANVINSIEDGANFARGRV